MGKQAIYFEDLQKTQFVIKVVDGELSYLEQRLWNKNDYEFCPGDVFERYRAQVGTGAEEYYQWIAVRSTLIATSVDTPQWTDREWVLV